MKRISSSHLVDSFDTLLSLEITSNDDSAIHSMSNFGSLSLRSYESIDMEQMEIEDMFFYVYIDPVYIDSSSQNEVYLKIYNDSLPLEESFSYDTIKMTPFGKNMWKAVVSKKDRDLQFRYAFQTSICTETIYRIGDLEQFDMFDIFSANLNTKANGDVLHEFLSAFIELWSKSDSSNYVDSLYFFLRSFQSLIQRSQEWTIQREGIAYSQEEVLSSVRKAFSSLVNNLGDDPKNALASIALLGYVGNIDFVTYPQVQALLEILKSEKSIEFPLKEEVSSSIRHMEWIVQGFGSLIKHPQLNFFDKILWIGGSFILLLLEYEECDIKSFISEDFSREATKQYINAMDSLRSNGALGGSQCKGTNRIKYVLEQLIRIAPSFDAITYLFTKNDNIRILNSNDCISALRDRLEYLDGVQCNIEHIDFRRIYRMLEYCKGFMSFEDIVCQFLKSNVFKKVHPSYSIKLLTILEETFAETNNLSAHSIFSIKEWFHFFLNEADITFNECVRSFESIIQLSFLKEYQLTFVEELFNCKHVTNFSSSTELLSQLVGNYDTSYCSAMKVNFFQKKCLQIIKDEGNNTENLSKLFVAICEGCGDRHFTEQLLWRVFTQAQCMVSESSVVQNPVWELIITSKRKFQNEKLKDALKDGAEIVRKVCKQVSTQKVSLETFRLLLSREDVFLKLINSVDRNLAHDFTYNIERLKSKFANLQEILCYYHIVLTNYLSNFQIRFPGDTQMGQLLFRRFDSPDTLALDEAEYVVKEFSQIVTEPYAKWLYNLRSSELFLGLWKKEVESMSTKNETQIPLLLSRMEVLWKNLFNGIDTFETKNSDLEALFQNIIDEKIGFELERLLKFNSPHSSKVLKGETESRWISKRTSYLLHFRKRLHYTTFIGNVSRILENLKVPMNNLSKDKDFRNLLILKENLTSTLEADFPLKDAKCFVGYPFYSLSTIQMQFLSTVGSKEPLIKLLANHSSDTDFANLISISKQCDDDAKIWDTLESLCTVRSLMHDVLYCETIESISDIEKRMAAMSVSAKHIQEAKSLVNEFHFLQQLFRERTLSLGTQSVHILRNIMNGGEYHVGTKITCVVRAPKMINYDLDYLMDLRSKLMLAEIPQEISGSEAHIYQFVRQIPLLLDIQSLHRYLCNQGHFDVMEDSFHVIPSNATLSEISRKVESLRLMKSSWKEVVRKARRELYSLNFFPMHQIALISKELFRYNSEESLDHLTQIFQSVAEGLTPEKVKQFLDRELFSEEFWNRLTPEEKLMELGNLLHRLLFDAKKTSLFKPRSWRNDSTMKSLSKEIEEEPFNNIQFWEKAKTFKFCIVSKETYKEVLDCIMTIFASEKRIPNPDEVFICDENSMIEDIILVINRWYYSQYHNTSSSLYCIANIHFLSYSAQARIFVHLNQLLRSCTDENRKNMATLVLLNASNNESGMESQHLLTALSQYIVPFWELKHTQLVKIFQWIVSRQKTGSMQLTRVMCYWSMFPEGGKTHAILKAIQKRSSHYERVNLDTAKIDDLVELLATHRYPEGGRNFHFLIGHEPHVSIDILLFQLFYIGILRSSSFAYSFFQNPNDSYYLELAGRCAPEYGAVTYQSLSVPSHLPQTYISPPNSSKFHLDFERYHFFTENGKLLFRFIPDSTLKNFCQFLINFRSRGNVSTSSPSRLQCIEVLNASFRDYTLTKEELNSVGKIYRFASTMMDIITKITFKKLSREQTEWLIRSAADFSCSFVAKREERSQEFKKIYQDLIRWEDILPHKRFTVVDSKKRIVYFIARSSRDHPEIHKEANDNVHVKCFQDMSHDILQPLICNIFGVSRECKGNTTYALADGHSAMILHLAYRLKYNYSCILVAETGSGKSESIRYIANVLGVDMYRFSLHGGHQPQDIIQWLRPIVEKAKNFKDQPIFVFIDQLHSSTCMSFFKDMICDRIVDSQPLPENLKIVAAANPCKSSCGDRRHSISSPVQSIPEAIFQFALDFGRLTEGREQKYIESIILNELNLRASIARSLRFANDLSCIVAFAQRFTRNASGDDSSTSLRDVKRFVKLFNWFLKNGFDARNSAQTLSLDECLENPSYHSIVGKSVILALAHCYYYRLSEKIRQLFEEAISPLMQKHPNVFFGCVFQESILEEQDRFAKMMEIPNGISMNKALRENIFVILVSIMNFIPCFIIGKSGSSKSLAMEVIKHNLGMKGVLKTQSTLPLPFIETFVYSCSKLSTSEGLIQTFNAARRYRNSNTDPRTITCVLLNEVGLLEESPHFPLKVLYRELNDPDSQIAIIGLSNFQFDTSVSNRTIVVSRTPPDEKDLSMVVRGIVDSRHLDNNLSLLARGYQAVYNNQKRWGIRDDFFGLRDLYALVKYINLRLKHELDEELLSAAVFRNFGGVPRCLPEILKCFFVAVGFDAEALRRINFMPVLNRVRDNIMDTNSRNLMLISENNTSLHHLFDQKILNLRDAEVIFGNGFVGNSNDDTHIVMTIQRIKACMMEGKTVVLVGCDDLYNSLYDLFNMQYTEIYGKRYVSLALGTYSKMCLVHQNFKAIVIVDKKMADSTLAIALLNRFEKQSFDDSDLIVSEEAQQLTSKLESWVSHFRKGSEIQNEDGKHIKTQAFAGMHPNLVNSLVVNLMLRYGHEDQTSLFKRGVRKLLNIATTDAIVRSRRRFGSVYFDTYFQNKKHVSLEDLIPIIQEKRKRTINILTYSPASIDIAYVLSQAKSLSDVAYAYAHKFDSKSDVQSCLVNFFESKNTVLIFQCDLSVVSQQKIQQIKIIGERLRLDYPSLERKSIAFLIHIHPFQTGRYYVHFTSDEMNVFLDEIQTITPSFLTLITEPLSSYINHLNVRSIILSSFRTSLSQLGFSDSEVNMPRKIRIVSSLLHEDRFWGILKPKIFKLISQFFSKKNPTYWSEFVAMNVESFFELGNYCQSLVSHVTQMIIFSFSYILAQTDVDWNWDVYLRMLGSQDEASKAGVVIWEEAWNSLDFPPHHNNVLSNINFSNWPENLMKIHSNGIVSRFPFSFIHCRTLHELRAVCEHSRTCLLEVLKAYILFALPHLADIPQELALNYLNDYLGIYGFDTKRVSKEEQLQIATFLLKAVKPNFKNLAVVQEFLWTQEERLHTYFSALECVPGTTQQFIQRLSKPIILLSLQQCDVFLLETLFEALYPPQRIAVSETYQFSEEEWLERISAVTIPILQLLSIIPDPNLRRKHDLTFRSYLLHKLYLKEVGVDGYTFWNHIKNENILSTSCSKKIILWGLKTPENTSMMRFLEFYCRGIMVDESIFSLLSARYLEGNNIFPSVSLMITIMQRIITTSKVRIMESKVVEGIGFQFDKKSFVDTLCNHFSEKKPSLLTIYVEAHKNLFQTNDLKGILKILEEIYPSFAIRIQNQQLSVHEFCRIVGLVKAFTFRAEEFLFRCAGGTQDESRELLNDLQRFLDSPLHSQTSLNPNLFKNLILEESRRKRGYSGSVEILSSSFCKRIEWSQFLDIEHSQETVSPYRILLSKTVDTMDQRDSKYLMESYLKKKYTPDYRMSTKCRELLQAIEGVPFFLKKRTVRRENIISCIVHLCSMYLGSSFDDPFFKILLFDQKRISKCFLPAQQGFEDKLDIQGNYCHGISDSEEDPSFRDSFYNVRSLSPLSTRIVLLWTHMLVFIGMIIAKDHVKGINHEAVMICRHWDYFVQLFNGDEELACAHMFSVCSSYHPKESFFKKPFASFTICEMWELHFESQVKFARIPNVSKMVENACMSDPNLRNLKNSFSSSRDLSNDCSFSEVKFQNFRLRLLKEDQNRFPILRHFVLHFAQIQLTKYIPSVQGWIEVLDKNLNRKTDKIFLKEHTIEEFINSFEQSHQLSLRTLFSKFSTAYNSLFVKNLSPSSSLYECIQNSHRLLDSLIRIHNDMVRFNQRSISTISISSKFASEHHLIQIDIERDISPAISLYSDLGLIENYIREKYIDGKPLIELSMPTFVFLESSTDMIGKSQVGAHLSRVIPQTRLQKDTLDEIVRCFQDTVDRLSLQQVLQEIEQMILIIDAIARSTSSLPHASDTKIGFIAKNLLLFDESSTILKYPVLCNVSLQNIIDLFESLHGIKNSQLQLR